LDSSIINSLLDSFAFETPLSCQKRLILKAFLAKVMAKLRPEDVTKTMGWINKNKDVLDKLIATIQTFDDRTMLMFRRAIIYNRKTEFNLLKFATKVLKRRSLMKRMHGLHLTRKREKNITLANGLKCTINHHKNSGWFIDWFVVIRCKRRRVLKLSLQLNQVASLMENSTKNLAAFKHLRPQKIERKQGKKWVSMPKEAYPTIIKTVAETRSLEIITLLSPNNL